MYVRRRGSFRFSRVEIKELAIAALAITLIFVWPIQPTTDWFIVFGFYLVFVGLGFTLHEVAHKLMAQSLGAWSEFRMWSQGLLFALFMRVIGGPIFIAPGATLWSKRLATIDDHGKVALAGPITNILLALIFVGLAFMMPVMVIGAYVNLQLAFFNLLPFGPLDGASIFRWKWWVWASSIVTVMLLQQVLRQMALLA
ncbi:MAG: site-2 protease family protein [Candidatus Altiarchaeota archaeon]|nr:site-2 protease family protein [Candidatus Altiarchaeota archaeon]